MNTYMSGALVRETATFTDLTGDAADPTTVTLMYKTGSAATVTLTYADAQITRLAAGVYYVDFDTSGWAGPDNVLWVFQWTGTGAVQAITTDSFDVTPPAL